MATRTLQASKVSAEKVQCIQVDCRKIAVDDDLSVGGDLAVTGSISINGVAVTSTAAELNILDGVTATAAELNNAADVSGRAVAAGSTLTLVEATHQGKLIKLDTATGSVVTLPTSTGSGAVYRFVVSALATSNNHIIKVGNATDVLRGFLAEHDSDTSDASVVYNTTATSDTITIPNSGAGGLVGNYVEVCDAVAGFFTVQGWYSKATPGTIFSAGV